MATIITPDDLKGTQETPAGAVQNPESVDLNNFNAFRKTKNPLAADYTSQGAEKDAAAIEWAKQNGYDNSKTYATPTPTPTPTATPQLVGTSDKNMTGGINNSATNSSVTTEKVDTSQVEGIIKSMQNEGLSYGQAFDKYYPKPQQNNAAVANIHLQQKTALFADMLRLVSEGVGASKGATVSARNQSSPYAQLQAKLMNEYAIYSKNMTDWQAKGVDAAMKDMQMRADMYKNAPKTKTTVQDNAWDRSKFETEQGTKLGMQKNDQTFKAGQNATNNAFKAGESAKDRAARLEAARISATQKTPKVTQLTFADNNGAAVIDNTKHEGVMSAAYQAILTDPKYSGNLNAQEIEAIKNDYSFEGKQAKVRVFVEQHAHQSPAAQAIIRSQADSYTRTTPTAAPASTYKVPSLVPTPSPTGAKSRLSATTAKSRL